MDVLKENAVTFSDRSGLKNKFNSGTFSASKKQNALSDVRNTVHKKNIGESSLSKQFLESNEQDRELRTPSPRRKQTPLVKLHEEVSTIHEDMDDHRFTICRCNMNDHINEDDFLPEELQFTEADIDNLTKIWYGLGGRNTENKYVFTPLKINRDIDWGIFAEDPKLTEISSNDSGIELDIELELNEIYRDFQLLL